MSRGGLTLGAKLAGARCMKLELGSRKEKKKAALRDAGPSSRGILRITAANIPRIISVTRKKTFKGRPKACEPRPKWKSELTLRNPVKTGAKSHKFLVYRNPPRGLCGESRNREPEADSKTVGITIAVALF